MKKARKLKFSSSKITEPQASIEGTLSVEHLHHFRCGSCDKWWSIGDPSIALPGKNSATNKEWFCPWCGKKNVFKA